MPDIDIDFKVVVLIGAVLFLIFYSLYLTGQWFYIIGLALCLVAGILVFRATLEDWDKRWGMDGVKEGAL